jgi:hypothetical protein
MFTLATAPRILLESPRFFPSLKLQGRIPPKYAAIQLEARYVPDPYLNWPLFHNGVAMALRVSPENNLISRAWILSNQHHVSSFEHAGMS